MIGKIMQWVPVEGTRWRNEAADGGENHALGSHSGVALGGDMAPVRKLPNTAAFCGVCGRPHGDSGFSLYQTQNRKQYAVNKRVTLSLDLGGPEHH